MVAQGFEAALDGFFGGAGGGFIELLLGTIDLSHQFALQFEDVIGADLGDRVGGVAVQVDECAECADCFAIASAAGEEPVDGAFFVGLDVVGDEFGEEVATDAIAGAFVLAEGEGVGDEVEVFSEVGFTVGGFDEFDEAGNEVVVEVGLVGDGQNCVGVGGEDGVLAGVEGLSGVD